MQYDSIGIKLIGKHINDKTHVAATACQNTSRQSLANKLNKYFSAITLDVYKYPVASYKKLGEASAVKWIEYDSRCKYILIRSASASCLR